MRNTCDLCYIQPVESTVDVIRKRISDLDLFISRLRDSISKREDGRLGVSHQYGKARYYQVVDNKWRYLGSDSLSTIQSLAQKQYEEKLLSAALMERESLGKCLDIVCSSIKHGVEGICGLMDEDIRRFVVPDVFTDDGYSRVWMNESFYQQEKTDRHRFETLSKDLVRSKSEVLIADRLYNAGVPFRYEQQLLLGDRFVMHCFYPDFTILNKRTRQIIYWEHFGMMGDKEYCSDNLKKLEVYAEYGVLPGKNLILTFEGGDKQLSTSYVGKMISAYLQ